MNTEETVSVAVPVWTTGGSVICSIGCSTPGYYANEALIQNVLDALWGATVNLSQEFGCEQLPLPKPRKAPRLAKRKH
jgi:DNA-binding IclR family transcriptional regulator